MGISPAFHGGKCNIIAREFAQEDIQILKREDAFEKILAVLHFIKHVYLNEETSLIGHTDSRDYKSPPWMLTGILGSQVNWTERMWIDLNHVSQWTRFQLYNSVKIENNLICDWIVNLNDQRELELELDKELNGQWVNHNPEISKYPIELQINLRNEKTEFVLIISEKSIKTDFAEYLLDTFLDLITNESTFNKDLKSLFPKK